MFHEIGIVGLGLIGGSLGKRIREEYPEANLYGLTRSQATCDAAVADGTFNEAGTSLDSFPNRLELVFIATPISLTNAWIQQIADHVNCPCIITDVASIKQGIGEQVAFKDGQTFIGGHPMAGKEVTGYEHAEAAMLDGATYILTPSDNPDKVPQFSDFLRSLSFKVIHLDAETHDRLLAGASHFPFMMAALTTKLAKDPAKNLAFKDIISSGFRDTTRVAGGSVDWATDICLQNRNNLLENLSTLEQEIAQLKTFLAAEDTHELQQYFQDIKSLRDSLYT